MKFTLSKKAFLIHLAKSFPLWFGMYLIAGGIFLMDIYEPPPILPAMSLVINIAHSIVPKITIVTGVLGIFIGVRGALSKSVTIASRDQK